MALKLNDLLEKLAGDANSIEDASSASVEETSTNRTDSEYIEKIASALDFMVSNTSVVETEPQSEATDRLKSALSSVVGSVEERTKEASEEASDEASVTNAVSRLRESLRVKIASKDEAAKEEEDNFIGNVLTRIQAMNASGEPEVEIDQDEDGEKTAAPNTTSFEDVPDTLTDEADDPAEDSTKVAGRLTLADMLEKAIGDDSEQAADSVLSESVKTAASHDESASASSKLRNSLLGRARR